MLVGVIVCDARGTNAGAYCGPPTMVLETFFLRPLHELDNGLSIDKGFENVGFPVVHGDFEARCLVGLNGRNLQKGKQEATLIGHC